MNRPPLVRAARTCLLATAAYGLAATPAFAAGAGADLGIFIQNIIDLLNNSVIRGLAVLAVIVMGIGWMFGHLDLRSAGRVVVAIIVVFGASAIVDMLIRGRGGA